MWEVNEDVKKEDEERIVNGDWQHWNSAQRSALLSLCEVMVGSMLSSAVSALVTPVADVRHLDLKDLEAFKREFSAQLESYKNDQRKVVGRPENAEELYEILDIVYRTVCERMNNVPDLIAAVDEIFDEDDN